MKFKKVLKDLKKLLLAKKLVEVKDFLLLVIAYGLLINYPLSILLNQPFDWYTVPAWGIFYSLISNEFVSFIRRIFNRR